MERAKYLAMPTSCAGGSWEADVSLVEACGEAGKVIGDSGWEIGDSEGEDGDSGGGVGELQSFL